MTKSNSKSEDKNREQQSRVNQVHGGQLVEAIATEDLESFNDADCKHETLVRDEDEIAFNTFVCKNPDCHEVFLFDKVEM